MVFTAVKSRRRKKDPFKLQGRETTTLRRGETSTGTDGVREGRGKLTFFAKNQFD